jgi:hypothetical protein
MPPIFLPSISKWTLVLIGVFVISLGANIYTFTHSGSRNQKQEQKAYKDSLKVSDAAIDREHKLQARIDSAIGELQSFKRDHQLKDSILEVEHENSVKRLISIQKGYEKINSRYTDITNDSLAKLFAR